MKVIIHPSRLKGNIQAPASKSSMQRALAAALLTRGTSVINNPGHSNDDKAALKVIEALGAVIDKKHEQLVIESIGVKIASKLEKYNVDMLGNIYPAPPEKRRGLA